MIIAYLVTNFSGYRDAGLVALRDTERTQPKLISSHSKTGKGRRSSISLPFLKFMTFQRHPSQLVTLTRILTLVPTVSPYSDIVVAMTAHFLHNFRPSTTLLSRPALIRYFSGPQAPYHSWDSQPQVRH